MVRDNAKQSSELLSNVRSKLPKLPDMDPSTLKQLKDQALARAKSLHSQVHRENSPSPPFIYDMITAIQSCRTLLGYGINYSGVFHSFQEQIPCESMDYSRSHRTFICRQQKVFRRQRLTQLPLRVMWLHLRALQKPAISCIEPGGAWNWDPGWHALLAAWSVPTF